MCIDGVEGEIQCDESYHSLHGLCCDVQMHSVPMTDIEMNDHTEPAGAPPMGMMPSTMGTANVMPTIATPTHSGFKNMNGVNFSPMDYPFDSNLNSIF